MKRLPCTLLALVLFAFSALAQGEFTQEGKASYYADKFHGRSTASGERYDRSKHTAAHMSLPFGTVVRVTNVENGKSTVVRINDRGPFVPNRIIDLSQCAAEELEMTAKGVADVKIVTVSASELSDTPAATAPAPQPAPKPTPIPAPIPPVSQKPTTPTSSSSSVSAANDSEAELYAVTVAKSKLTGFGVQIANFQSLTGLFKQISEIDLRGISGSLNVYLTEKDASTGYRLVVGPFATRSEAEQERAKLSSRFEGCFIISF